MKRISSRGLFKTLVRGYKISMLRKIKKEIRPEVIEVIPKKVEIPPKVEEEKIEIKPKKLEVEGVEIPSTLPPTVKIAKPPKEEKEKILLVYPLIPKKPAPKDLVFAYAKIFWNKKENRYVYQVIEPELTERLAEMLKKIRTLLEQKLDVDFSKLTKAEAKEYLRKKMEEAIGYYGFKLHPIEKEVLHYYAERDFIGLGKIEPLMNDDQIEDISCDGLGIPIFVFHRNPMIGSVVTNVVYKDAEELDSFIIRLSQLCGKSVSVASPLLNGSLPDGSRVQATLATDIARKGSNFTIRKFTESPLTPVHLLLYNTLDTKILAYLWLCVEYGASMFISGGTATGKTSLLNVLSLFIRPEEKIVSIEDSVTGDSKIWIKRGKKLEFLPIEKVFKDEAKNGIKIISKREICEPKELYTLSLDENGKIVFSSISKLIRHRVDKDIYEIITYAGRKIKTTGDHSLFSIDENGKITPVKVCALNKGDFIATPRILPIETDGLKTINLLEHLKELKGLYVAGPSIRLLLKSRKVRSTLQKWKKNYNWWFKKSIIPCSVLHNLLKLGYKLNEQRNLKIRTKVSSLHALPLQLKLDKYFLYFVGLWLAEGCYYNNSVIISNSSPECRKIVMEVGKRLNIIPRNHSDGVSLMLNSAVLKTIMKNVLDLKGDAYTKKIPSWVFCLSKKQLAYLLSGYFSGDGSVAKYEVEASSCSSELLSDIQTLLLRFGIVARTSWRKEKDGTYKLRISDVEMIGRFKEIGFLQKEKQRRLNEISSRAIHKVSDVIPLPKHFYFKLKSMLREDVGKRLTYKTWKSWHRRYITGNSNIGRNTLQEIVSKKLLNGGSEILWKLAHNDLFWDRIKKIRKLKSGNGKKKIVYDISVPKLENFICNNFVAHNTAELRLPHPHWVPQVARVPIATEKGEVDLFALLKESLRQRPDYIIVGEVRGPEAFVLFQQIATGHPSLATIHAEDMPKLVDRLITPPISLPPALIENLNLVIFLLQTRYKGKQVRRVNEVLEIIGFDREKNSPITNLVFKWNPTTDTFDVVNKSVLLKKFAAAKGMSEKEVAEELQRRMLVLNWMLEQNVLDYRDVFKIITTYYTQPEVIISLAKG